MTFHILTHNQYAIASFITLTLGNFFIANHIYERILSKYNFKLMTSNLLTEGFIFLLGCTVVSLKSLINDSFEIQLMGACTGIIIGYSCLAMEAYLISLLCTSPKNKPRFTGNITMSSGDMLKGIKYSALEGNQPTYLPTVVLGILEEVLYRGFLTALCMALARFHYKYRSIDCCYIRIWAQSIII